MKSLYPMVILSLESQEMPYPKDCMTRQPAQFKGNRLGKKISNCAGWAVSSPAQNLWQNSGRSCTVYASVSDEEEKKLEIAFLVLVSRKSASCGQKQPGQRCACIYFFSAIFRLANNLTAQGIKLNTRVLHVFRTFYFSITVDPDSGVCTRSSFQEFFRYWL